MTIFHDPREFLNHLEQQAIQDLTPEQSSMLIKASCHVIKYLLDSQHVVSGKMISAVDCLNQNHESWGHKLSELYGILEAGEVDAHSMNLILKQEVCHDRKDP